MKNCIIRTATVEDAEALLNIYAYYVTDTVISFEYDVPTVEEFRRRIEKTTQKYPYFVIEKEGKLLGYAYAGPFVGRAAYQWCAELTIYLQKDAKRCGYGRMLYEALEKELKMRGYLNLYACIGDPVEEDEYLTRNSEQFHSHMGFEKIGTFYKCGHKFGRWYHMIWMEKIIGEHKEGVAKTPM